MVWRWNETKKWERRQDGGEQQGREAEGPVVVDVATEAKSGEKLRGGIDNFEFHQRVLV